MRHTLAIKTGAVTRWGHDPSAALFRDGELLFAAEEERFRREKHAADRFPEGAIRAALADADLSMADIDALALTTEFSLVTRGLRAAVDHERHGDPRLRGKALALGERLARIADRRLRGEERVRAAFRTRDWAVPPVRRFAHHRCHAASAFHPSGFDEALVLTLDGRGEYDSTVVWRAGPDADPEPPDGAAAGRAGALERVRTDDYPNSLGSFYAVVTEFLGYRANNGEGKVMGLAPYGERDPAIESAFRSLCTFGADYDVTDLTTGPDGVGVERLERALGIDRRAADGAFTDAHRDVARVAQALLEETVLALVERYTRPLDTANVCLAGGVALNCKLNKRVREADAVDTLFVQPVAHDGGLALGAGMLDAGRDRIDPWTGGEIYAGSTHGMGEIRALLDEVKLDYTEPTDLVGTVADALADGALVGWFQGRSELGPRALGNRSILADPRTAASRDRVNEHVKHREGWRPFAPSMHREAAEAFLERSGDAPYMIRTFDVRPDRRPDLEAVCHPADDTTRPQTVTPESNPRYHRLLDAFADRTGLPVLLNTSFNDHGEPIVDTPKQALTDFYRMGLDVLVLEEAVLTKPGWDD
jgi:carbamoyltransferase